MNISKQYNQINRAYFTNLLKQEQNTTVSRLSDRNNHEYSVNINESDLHIRKNFSNIAPSMRYAMNNKMNFFFFNFFESPGREEA